MFLLSYEAPQLQQNNDQLYVFCMSTRPLRQYTWTSIGVEEWAPGSELVCGTV